ncbi:MAG: hypothetical protein U0R44_01775 [Candidatus Micrarchaeia archaeon]
MRFFIALILLAAIAFPANLGGDGTEKLHPGEYIQSFTGFTVILSSVGSHALQNGSVSLDNATYSISYEGKDLGRMTLAPGEERNITLTDVPGIARRILFVRLVNAGTDADGTFAKTRVGSQDYTAPAPPEIGSVNATPHDRYVEISWTTDKKSNATVYLTDGNATSAAATLPVPQMAQSANISGLKPGRGYSIRIKACEYLCAETTAVFNTTGMAEAPPPKTEAPEPAPKEEPPAGMLILIGALLMLIGFFAIARNYTRK